MRRIHNNLFFLLAVSIFCLPPKWSLAEDGVGKKSHLYLISIGYDGRSTDAMIRETTEAGATIRQRCPTCVTDAEGLDAYFHGLAGLPTSGIDSVFSFTYTKANINVDTLYAIFDLLRKRVSQDDYVVFYYASSSWGTWNQNSDKETEAYYVLNPSVFAQETYDQDAFTLRQLKMMTDRLLSDRLLIIFDTGNGNIIRSDFYRNFFSENILEAGFTRKKRVILCPEDVSSESIDKKDGKKKGDLYRIISSLPDEYSILNVFENHTITKEYKSKLDWGQNDFSQRDYKYFMLAFWKEQLEIGSQIKILREKEYLELLGFIKPAATTSGKRGLKPNQETAQEVVDTLQANRTKKALVIATSDYQSEQWSRLKNPLSDGDSIANVLASRYGYIVDKKYNATREEILQAIDDLAGESSNNPYSQYVLYIAGHGFFDPRQQAGYLVCRDSKTIQNTNRPGTLELGSYIDYTTLYRRLGADLNRIVMIVDVCFGGASYNNFPGSQDLVDPSQEKNKKKQPYKKVLASGITEVDDFIRTESGAASRNSPFASQVLKALRRGKKDALDFDSVFGSLITAEPKLKPKPVQFSFGKTALSGEFIF